MIINDKDAEKRLNSPMNLINRLKNACGGSSTRKNDAMKLFGVNKKTELVPAKQFNPFEAYKKASEPLVESPEEIKPSEEIDTDTILADPKTKIKLSLAHDKALDLLNRAVDELSNKISEVSPSKLPSVISAASKTVESIRRERLDANKNNKDKDVHFHFYTPERKKLTDYEVVVDAVPGG